MFYASAALIGLLLSSAPLAAQDGPDNTSEVPNNAQILREWNTKVLQLHTQLRAVRSMSRDSSQSPAVEALKQRAAVMSQMMEKDPRAVLDTAFSPEVLKVLSEAYPDAPVEQRGEFTGLAEQIVADDENLVQAQSDINMNIDGEWVNVKFPNGAPDVNCNDILNVEGVRLGEVVAAANGYSSGSGGAGSTCNTTGTQYIAVLLVTFPGVAAPTNVTPQLMEQILFQSPGRSVKTFWEEASQGKTSASGKAFGWFTLDKVYSCTDYKLMRDAAIKAADGSVNFKTFNRIMIVFPPQAGCGWAGLGTVGCTTLSSPSDGTFVASVAWLTSKYISSLQNGVQLASHEGGHNLGLHHARTFDFGAEALGKLGTTGAVNEYGDSFSTMGGWNYGHYSAPNKIRLKWFDESTQSPTINKNGVYNVVPFSQTTPGQQALKIQRGTGNTNAWLYLEYRQPVGQFDSTLPSQIFSGATIHYDEGANTYTNLLDFTPETASWTDPALAAGKSWNDPYSDLNLQILGATSNGLSVSVSYGAAPCVANAPSMAVSPANPSGQAGDTLTYTVTVTNQDSSGCSPITLSPSSTAPAAWATSFSPSSITLTPGASATFTMDKVVPASATEGTVAANVTASDTKHTKTVSASATVVPASLACTVAAPSISMVPSATSGAPGDVLTFTVTVANNDSAGCKAITLNAASAAPAGWASSFSRSSFSVAPGASASFNLMKTIPAGATAGISTGDVTVSDAQHTATASFDIDVKSAADTSCVVGAPKIAIVPWSTGGDPGDALTFTVTVTNTDSASCKSATFSVKSTAPAGWATSFSRSSFTVPPGAAAGFNVVKRIPSDATATTFTGDVIVGDAQHNATGTYTITVKNAGASCTAAAPTLSVSPSSASGDPGATMTYTVTVTNNDSSGCKSSTLAASSNAPSGWATTYSKASVTVAPGASASFNVIKTIPANASAGSYTGNVTLSDAQHTATATFGTTVNKVNSCTVAAPSISVTPNGLGGDPGTQLVYMVTVTNNDSSACKTATFAAGSSAPSGWATSYSRSTFSVAPGGSATFNIIKTIPSNAAAGTYNGNVSVGDAQHTATASYNATVNSAAAACVPSSPSIRVASPTLSGLPGALLSYTVTITNNDSPACKSSTFSAGSTAPSAWVTLYSRSTVTLAPGASGAFNMIKTIPLTALLGNYSGNVIVSDATRSAVAALVATVTAPLTTSSVTSLKATLNGPASLTLPGFASLNVTVISDGAPAARAKVTYTVTLPNGLSSLYTVNADAFGAVSLAFKPTTAGTYSVKATATFDGATVTSNTISIAVK